MFLIFVILIIGVAVSFLLFRFYLLSFLTYLSVRFERRGKDFEILSSLRENLIHERKKKMAGLEMILSSWEKGEEIQPRYEYFQELLDQLKNLIQEERRNLMAVTKDIWLWGKLWHMLRHVEKIGREKREIVDIRELRTKLSQIQNLIDQVVESATEQFSFTLNQVVAESVKIVRVEKSHLKNIAIKEQLDEVGNTIRFSYDKFKEWQRILTNLIRNAVEAVETKKSGDRDLGLVATPPLTEQEEAGVAADFSLRGGEESYWVKVSTKKTVSDSVSVFIEDSGIGMDEITRSSFYKKGFTFGKKGGLGLGVSEESVEFINRYGNWQIESQKGVGTTITINIDREKAQKAELILPAPKPFHRTKLAFGLFFFLLALIGLALLFTFDKYSRFWVDWNPALAEVNEDYLIIKNKSEIVLWDLNLPSRINYAYLDMIEPLVECVDLDHDGRKEVLVGINFTEETTGKILCFDYKKHKLWEFACGDSGIYKGCSGYFFPIHLVIEDLFGDSKEEIIVNSAHSIWFPDQLAVLDHKGNMLSEYWHPGIFGFMACSDFDSDGEKEIILGGMNNRMGWRPAVSILEPGQVYGQAMPYNATKEMEKAKEEWYLVFPHIKKSLPDESDWVHFLSSVSSVRVFTEQDEVQVNMQDSRNYFLSLNFELSRVFDYNYRAWKELRRFPYDLTEEDKENWKNIQVWKDASWIE